MRRKGLFPGLLAVSVALSSATAEALPFNFDTGNAPLQVITPKLLPAVRQFSPGANDATLVIRVVTLIDNAAFDAIAPYHPTAVGVYSRLGRRPASESATNRNKNIAILYSVYRVLNSLMPQNAEDWRKMMRSVDLDPDDNSQDTTTPIGIGNVAGAAVVAAREHDGMNQLGDEGGRKYNRRPYEDYTGYEPVNTAYELIDASRWQPDIITNGGGVYRVQQATTPQVRYVRPYSYDDPNDFRTPPPLHSNPYTDPAGYKAQADYVLAASAGLTDRQKMQAEFFDDKFVSLGGVAVYLTAARGLTLDEFVHLDFGIHMAAFDGAIACWNDKHIYDAVRPFSAIAYLYGDQPVTAWGGPGKGTVTDLPGNQWRSYLQTSDHPEYPSGGSCFCAAAAQVGRRLLQSEALGYFFPFAKGSSKREPGLTPRRALVVGPWQTWQEFENACSMSRVLGGIHFLQATEEGKEQCRPIAEGAYLFLKEHIDGTAPAPVSAARRP